ncbi:MAG: DUF655 domain-containing protein [Candidatus Aenigmarchaeota archaeon]|nr:DUF655 domain-containing protein [Candidatus Aenigmarchaeota archaeon]
MPAKDEHLIVLDFLPMGKSVDRRAEPIIQGIGEKYFSLLEVVSKEGVTVKAMEKVYIGEGKRDHVKYIRGKIRLSELTSYAKDVLEEVVNNIVTSDEKRFVDFFNNAQPLNTRVHSLELLPGIGKKNLWQILQERKKKPFESFVELHQRIPMLTDPKKMVIKRVMDELEGKDRHNLFVSAMV